VSEHATCYAGIMPLNLSSYFKQLHKTESDSALKLSGCRTKKTVSVKQPSGMLRGPQKHSKGKTKAFGHTGSIEIRQTSAVNAAKHKQEHPKFVSDCPRCQYFKRRAAWHASVASEELCRDGTRGASCCTHTCHCCKVWLWLSPLFNLV
jgi:hypothetical protein